jgi:hypothetical protein
MGVGVRVFVCAFAHACGQCVYWHTCMLAHMRMREDVK